ncbi:MAG TPA: hypothetical protein VFS05_07930 [Gemmatimonadaceae bacterium]|nr:hypothetical protein [Gemmatimonadaceae bacterium]
MRFTIIGMLALLAHPALAQAGVPVGSSTAAVASSAAATAPLSTQLAGSWYFGDPRVADADSLALTLREDGTLRLMERRRSLDRDGWRLRRRVRTGSWLLRDDDGMRGTLCIIYKDAPRRESCDEVEVDAIGATRLQYAGRYWRKGATPPEQAKIRKHRRAAPER